METIIYSPERFSETNGWSDIYDIIPKKNGCKWLLPSSFWQVYPSSFWYETYFIDHNKDNNIILKIWLWLFHRLYCYLWKSLSYEKKDRHIHMHPSFFWDDANKLLRPLRDHLAWHNALVLTKSIWPTSLFPDKMIKLDNWIKFG